MKSADENSMEIPASPLVADFANIEAVPCPCGLAQRALMSPDNELASVHRVTISANARAHFHKQHTEIYIGVEGDGEIELNGERQPLRPGGVVMIPPGVRHRAVVEEGKTLVIFNIVMPPFDVNDEWFDE